MCKLKNETRELIIGMINEGLTNAQIAEKLDVSACTVENVRRYYNDPNWRYRYAELMPHEKVIVKAAKALAGEGTITIKDSRKKTIARTENGVKIKVYWRP